MRLSLFCSQLFTLTATSLAYNCNSYNFPLDGLWVPRQSNSNAAILDKFATANTDDMILADIWGNTGGPAPW